MVVFQLESLYFIYLFQAKVFSSFIFSVLHLLSFALNYLLFYITVSCLAYINFIASILFTSISLITFIQLKQLRTLITSNRTFHEPTFLHFRRLLSEALRLTLASNGIYGRMLLAFFTVYVPFNTFLVISIVRGQYSPVSSFILGNVVAFQFCAMIGFHILAIGYSSRLHGCTGGMLLHWCAQPIGRTSGSEFRPKSTLSRLVVANLAVTFHREPSQRFGVTYGSIGRLMTWATFGKCAFFYLQFMMYWYLLFN